MTPETSASPSLAPRPRRATATQSSAEPSPFSSRRPSQVMGPPALPHHAQMPGDSGEYSSAGNVPLRHPKPLTPADMHSMLEKEQEAIVNRLSRELSSLRQQTTSVASTTSSTSATCNEPDPPYLSAYPTTPNSRHRSSSSISSYIPAVQGSRTRSVSGIVPPRDTSIPGSRPPDLSRANRSRETSITSTRLPEGTSSLSSSLNQPGDHFPHRSSVSQANSMARFEETAHHRGELETIKQENETLRQRVRELELSLKKYREGVSPGEPSDGQSALAEQMNDASITTE